MEARTVGVQSSATWRSQPGNNVGQKVRTGEIVCVFSEVLSHGDDLHLLLGHVVVKVHRCQRRRTGLEWGGQQPSNAGDGCCFFFLISLEIESDATTWNQGACRLGWKPIFTDECTFIIAVGRHRRWSSLDRSLLLRYLCDGFVYG